MSLTVCGVSLAQVAINFAFSSVLWTLELVMLLQSYLGRWTTISVWQVEQRNF